jgi:hypothetical protein
VTESLDIRNPSLLKDSNILDSPTLCQKPFLNGNKYRIYQEVLPINKVNLNYPISREVLPDKYGT